MFKKILSIIVFAIASIMFVRSAIAANLTVQISDLPDYETTPSFTLTYTALQVDGDPITAQFYYQREGDPWRYLGGVLSGEAGSASTDSSYIGQEGKYYFKVIAGSSGESFESQTMTVIDWTAPGVPNSYSKERINNNTYRLKWKTPNDGDFQSVIVYRSKEQNFTADGGTEVARVGGDKDKEITWENTGLEINRDYYYALRSIDTAGNASGVVGDGGTVETVVTNPAGTVQGASSGSGAEGNVKLPLEENKGSVLGDEANTPTPTGQLGGGDSVNVKDVVSNNLPTLVVGVGLLAIAAFLLLRKKSS